MFRFSTEMSRARNELQRTPTFMDLYRDMEGMFVKPSAGTQALSHILSINILQIRHVDRYVVKFLILFVQLPGYRKKCFKIYQGKRCFNVTNILYHYHL